MSKSIVIKSRKRGMVALFMAITIQMILTFALLSFTENNMRYIDTTRNYEDKVKSKYLAMSSINFSLLLLTIQKRMIDPLNKNFKMNFQIWQQLPVSSELLSMVFDGDSEFFKSMIGMDDSENVDSQNNSAKEEYERKSNQKSKIDEKIKTRDKKSENKTGMKTDDDGNLKFENKFKFDGDFFAEITDENRKYNVNIFKHHAGQTGDKRIELNLTSLFNQPEYKTFFENPRENDTVIPPEEVVASIKDWIDSDDNRSGFNGGSEDDRYQYLKHKYRNKNDTLTSFQELYMIYGIDDDFMANFGESLTVYGKNEININTCDETVLRSIILGIAKNDTSPAYFEPYSQEMALLVSKILEFRTLAPFSKADDLYNIINSAEGISVDPIKKNKFKLTTVSNIFKITGYGTLNEAVSKIIVVVDTSNPTKQYLYYREE